MWIKIHTFDIFKLNLYSYLSEIQKKYQVRDAQDCTKYEGYKFISLWIFGTKWLLN